MEIENSFQRTIVKDSEESIEETHNKQEIWCWGAGTDGQLGTGKLQDELCPQLLRSLSSFRPITYVSCGGAHVIALCLDGQVLTWGRGNSGQLGHGEMVNSLDPKVVNALESFVIVHVSAGWNHSGFVSENGVIFTCGDGSFGKLGHDNHKSQCIPLEVSYFSCCDVKKVACGMRHTLVLVGENVENQVYAFGAGRRGQLGISNTKIESTSFPRMTLGLENLKITNIFANGDHSAALSAGGKLYTWGRGFATAFDEYVPQALDSCLSFHDVALGWNHALLLSEERKLYMLGGNRHGVLSDPLKTSMASNSSGESEKEVLQLVPCPSETKVEQIAAGAEHSALVTDDGSVMTWGWGEHGQLGLGDTNDQTAPQVLTYGQRFPEGECFSSKVYCGSGFSLLLRTKTVSIPT